MISESDNKTSILGNIRIVLVHPTHGGNIGATARAMKNMGLRQLFLVAPQNFPGEEARARASGADDVLDAAMVCDSLDEALQGCLWSAGTTARSRRLDWPALTPESCARRVTESAGEGDIALVFGRERMGLTNEEMDRCRFLVSIPANPEYSSLNLGQAVQIMTYELRKAFLGMGNKHTGNRADTDDAPASNEEVKGFFDHLEVVMKKIGFLDPEHPRKLMRRIYRLFHRAELQKKEVNILRGILTAVEKSSIRQGNDNGRS